MPKSTALVPALGAPPPPPSRAPVRDYIAHHLAAALAYAELYGNPHLATAIRVAQNELFIRDAEWRARQSGRRGRAP
jgi:hypothetical protein